MRGRERRLSPGRQPRVRQSGGRFVACCGALISNVESDMRQSRRIGSGRTYALFVARGAFRCVSRVVAADVARVAARRSLQNEQFIDGNMAADPMLARPDRLAGARFE